MSYPSQHHPQHTHALDSSTASGAGIGPTAMDVVAGDPPVPITIWRTARTGTDTGRSVPARLAARLVAAYSRPGDSVVDLSADHSLTTACAAGRRRHHRGWLTDPATLIVGPRTPAPSAHHDVTEGGDGADEVLPAAWFGDDLTDPDLPPPDQTTAMPPGPAPGHGTASLLVACWPVPGGDADIRVRLAALLSAAGRLLRPGGCLILILAIPSAAGTAADFTEVVAAAGTVGLSYLQHIVAVTADTDGDRFVYHATDEELLTLAHHAEPGQRGVAHLRVHADLVVLSKPAPPPSSSSRRPRCGDDHPHAGGGRRG